VSSKDDIIKIRVTNEFKEQLKSLAEQEGLNMSQFVLKYLQPVVATKVNNKMNHEKIESRAVATDDKMEKVKANLELRNIKYKESISYKIKNIFTKG
jgi:antitoxin component of RelBE/YafQ-DinJ toxin-antitoxin module